MCNSAKGRTTAGPNALVRTKDLGDRAEQLALEHLRRHGLALVRRNFRTPGRGGGEIDLIMREPDGTLVFVEVRQRAGQSRGGAAASITGLKQRRIVFAARHFLHAIRSEPPCRFDVVLVDGVLGPAARGAGSAASEVQVRWLQAAFDASATF
ncbi:MAG: YraN family protein [Burkholderiaceae bacterium]